MIKPLDTKGARWNTTSRIAQLRSARYKT